MTADPSNQVTPLSISDVVSRHDHLVVLGEPGSGKTTFLRYLALNHAQALRDHRDTDMGDARFPILLRIADYVQYGMHQGKSLSDYLVDDCTRHECSLPQLSDILQADLQAGRCLVLLDSLDEVVRGDDRRMVVERLEDFVRGSDEVPNRFIVTSRSAGYYEAPLSNTFAHYTLQGLEETDMRCLLESWYRVGEASDEAVAPISVQQVRREINDLIDAIQTVPGIRQFAANPLLLHILAQLHHEGKSLPQQRVVLYDQVTETLIRTWRVAQGVLSAALSEVSLLFDPTITNHLLSKLAYWLHCESSSESAHGREAYEELGKEWACLTDRPWDEENPVIEKEIKQFLRAVRDHTGILVEDPPYHYRFAHLTFEEYYAARYLVANLEELSERAEDALLHVLHDEDALVRVRAIETLNAFELSPSVFSTFIHMLSNDTDAHVRARIVECLADVDRPSKDVLPALLGALHDAADHVRTCAVESLGCITPPTPKVLTALLSVLRNDTFFGARWAVIKSLKDLRELPESAVLATVQTLLEDTHQVVRQDCTHLLRQGGTSSEQTIQALLKGLSDGDIQVRQACSQALVRLGQRFPERRDMITMQLERIIQERQDDNSSLFGLSTPCEMTYDALWLLLRNDP